MKKAWDWAKWCGMAAWCFLSAAFWVVVCPAHLDGEDGVCLGHLDGREWK